MPQTIDDVAIVGVSLRFPGASTLDEFWENLAAGRSLITEVPAKRWDAAAYYGDPRKEKGKSSCVWGGFVEDADAFDASFFKVSRREAELMDPQQRIALELGWKAVEDAGYRSDLLRGSCTGVFMAVTNNDYTEIVERELAVVDAFVNTGTSNAVISNRISHFLDFRGPSVTIDSACAGSLVAIHLAMLALRNGDCDAALAGGVNLCWSPRRFIALSQSGSLSKEGRCKTFDEAADGYVRGEGGGILVLKSLGKALADGNHIYAIVRGSGTNHGGRTNSLTVTSPKAHAELIRDIYEKAGVTPDTVTYVEAHGVGSPLGDSMEVRGLKSAFAQLYQKQNLRHRKGYCGIGSVKTNIGHTEAAAGVAGVLKVIAAIRNKALPETINIRQLNPLIDLSDSPFYMVDRLKKWEAETITSPRRAGVSAFGFGGGNAHVLLEEYLPTEDEKLFSVSQERKGPYLIPLSAKNPERLLEYVRLLLDFLMKLSGNYAENGAPDRSFQETLAALLSSIIHVPEWEVDVDAPLVDHGVEPLHFASLLEAIRERFGIVFEANEFQIMDSLASIAERLWQVYPGLVGEVAAEPVYSAKEGNGISILDAVNVSEIAYTFQVGRDAMEERVIFLASNVKELIGQLNAFVVGDDVIPHCFTGHVKTEKVTSAVSDEGTREIVKRLAVERDLGKIAELWTTGAHVDWEILHDGPPLRRAGLPTYPFARERYWVPCAEAETVSETLCPLPIIHPLLHRDVSDASGRRFESTFTGDEFFLADHVVKGRRILPGVAFVEMFRAALEAATSDKTGPFVLRNIVWLRPLTIDARSVRVMTTVAPRGKGDFNCEITTFAKGGGEPTIYSVAKGMRHSTVTAPVLDLVLLQGRCTGEELSGMQCYEAFAAAGFDYGPGHRAIERVLVGKGEFLARLVMPSSVLANSDRFVVHPSIADGTLQATLGLLCGFASLKPAIPFTVGLVEIFCEFPTESWCRVRYADGSSPDGKVRKFDVDVCDNQGAVCFRMEGVTFGIPEEDFAFAADKLATANEPSAASLALDPDSEAVSKMDGDVLPGRIETALAGIVSELLKVEACEIDPDIELNEYGFGSIAYTEFAEILNNRYGLDLAPTIFFEYSTLRDFGRYLAGEFSELLAVKLGGPEKKEIATRQQTVDNASFAARVEAVLAEQVSLILKVGIEDIDMDTDLNDYGFGSIAFTEFADKLNDDYGFDLTPTIFFEHTTLSGFARYLVEEYRELLAAHLNMGGTTGSLVEMPEAAEEVVPAAEPQLAQSSHSSPQEAKPTSESIAVVGISGVFPMARDVDEFWRNIVEGKDCISEIPDGRWDWREYYGDPAGEGNTTNVKWAGVVDGVDEFDPLFFGISPKEAETMDPQQRLLMTHAWKVIEDAGYSPQSLSETKTGIFVGTMNSGYVGRISKADVPMEGFSVTSVMPSVGPNRMSYFLNVHGPSEPIETACSSSLVAIHRAVSAIESGSCEMAIAGGVNTFVSPEFHVSISKAGMLSPDGRCKTFSNGANGFVRGEGAAMLFLKKLKAAEDAGDHIYGVIRGTAENHGGRASSLTAPNPKAQADVLVSAYAKAGIDPRTVSYIEAHGTGTELGDPIEINGLKAAFQEMYQAVGDLEIPSAHCGIGSVKTNVGHLELAAGVAGVVKVLLQLKHKTIPGIIHCDTVNPYIKLKDSPLYLVRETHEWKQLRDKAGNPLPRRAGVSSFGMGGVNAHVVIEEYIPREERCAPAITSQNPVLVLLSAKNEERLREQVGQLAAAVLEQRFQDTDLADIAFTLQVGRDAMEERLAFSATSLKELGEKLEIFLAGREFGPEMYRGQVKRNKETFALFAADEDMAKTVDAWLTKRKYAKLLALWVRGLDVDWRRLYGDQKPRRISLPTYPFARERYWIPESRQKSGVWAQKAGFHNAEPHPIDIRINEGGQPPDMRGALMRREEVRGATPEMTEVVAEVEPSLLLAAAVDHLKGMITEVTGIPVANLDSDAHFEELGLDSIMVSRLNQKTQRWVGKLDATLFFKYNNIRALAAYFHECYPAAIAGLVKSDFALKSVPACRSASLLSETTYKRSAIQSGDHLHCDIAIIGVAGRYPRAANLNEFWKNLYEGRDCIEEIPPNRWSLESFFEPDRNKAVEKGLSYSKWGGFLNDVDCFDPLFFNISPKDAMHMDPQERLFLEVAWECLEDAGYTRRSLERDGYGNAVGVFVGATFNNYQLFMSEAALRGNREMYPANSQVFSIANRVSYVMNFTGPSLTVDTACSSSFYALHLACESIRSGQSRMAIAGGVNLSLHPSKYITLAQGQFSASDGRCRAFCEGGTGYVPAEAVGAVFLKPLQEAVADEDIIYGVIKGTATSHGGKANGYTVPNPVSQSMAIEKALHQGGVDPRSISCIEAHGTGTALGDPIEITGLTDVFRRYTKEAGFCSISSVKSNIGHAEAAAGIAQLTKVLLQFKHQTLVKNVMHGDGLNPNIQFDETPFVVQEKTEYWKRPVVDGQEVPRRAGLSSFGAGGANAHVVVEEYISRDPQCPAVTGTLQDPVVIVLSAKNRDRLNEQVRRLLDALLERQWAYADLANIAWTLQVGREVMDERLAVVAGSLNELTEKLALFLDGREVPVLYLGGAKSRKKTSTFPGEDGLRESVDDWTRSGDYAKIAHLWVKGREVDWSKLYGDTAPHRVSLPAYPFARERYWVPEMEYASDATRETAVPANVTLHPLLHQNTSDLVEQRFTSTFTGREFFLTDHVVNGQKFLPGVAYLEMARAAMERSVGVLKNGQDGIRLKNVVWARPIVVGERPIPVHIGLYPKENEDFGYEIYSETAGTEPVVHGQGIAILGPIAEVPPLNLKALRTGCDLKTLSAEQCYESYGAMGINYGPAHQGIEEVYVGEGRVMAKLSLPSCVSATQDQFVLHPSLMDSALQAAIGFFVGSESGNEVPLKPILPFALDELEILDGSSSPTWALVRYSDNNGPTDNVKKFDFDLCDENGKIYVRMKGFSARVLDGDTALATLPPSDGTLMLTSAWNERPVPLQCPSFQYDRQLVVLCDQDDDVLESVETQIEGVRCLAFQSEGDGIAERFEFHCLRLFEEIQAVLRDKPKGKVLIQVVVSGTGEKQLFAGLSGLLKTACLENPKLSGQLIEVEPGDSPEQIIGKLRENSLSPMDNQIRYRDGRRYVACWKRLENLSDQFDIPWRDGGIYLISGGAGGLGNVFAEEIAHRVTGATVIMSGRSPLSEEKRVSLKKLETMSIRVKYRQADVASKDEVNALVKGIREEFGALDGVIHAAGVIRDSFIIKKTIEEFRDVLAPKVAGLVNLDRAIGGLPLDFFVLFSSISGSFGNPGQADYATANAFLDAYAGYRAALVESGQRRGRTLSVDWPLWKDGGMHVDDETEKMMRQRAGLVPMQTSTGTGALYRGMVSAHHRVMVVEGDLSKLQGLLTEPPTAQVPQPVCGMAENEGTLAVERDLILGKAIDYFKKLLSSVTKVPANRIDADAPLERYGVDSVMVMQMTNALEKIFGSLSKTLFFEYQNIKELTEYFLESFWERMSDLLGVDEKLAPSPASSKVVAAESVNLVPFSSKSTRFASRRAEAPSAGQVKALDIAIIGVAGRYPGASNVRQFWENLKDGKDCISEIPKNRWDHSLYFDEDKSKPGKSYCKWGGFLDGIDQFDPLFFNISPRDAEIMEPQERVFMETVWELLESSGYTKEMLELRYQGRIGLYVGAMYQLYHLLDSDIVKESASSVTSYSLIANRVSHYFNFQGPSVAIDTMCSSSAYAIHLACESLKRGESRVAIAGGVNLSIHPKKYIGLSQNKLIGSHIDSRSFGDGDGYLPSEGVGAVLLKPLTEAIIDGDSILAIIKSTATNHGGYTNGFAVPNPNAQAQLIEDNFAKSGMDPRSISYVEAAANGSALGDPIEITALNKVFKKFGIAPQSCPIGAVKSNIGHPEAASGMAQLTKVILQLQHRQLVPTIKAHPQNPNIDFNDTPFYLQRELQEWKRPLDITGSQKIPRRATISSFGAGGSNAHLIVEEYVPQLETGPVRNPSLKQRQIAVFSARNSDRLKESVRQMLEFMQLNPDLSLTDITYTLQVGREAMESRMALVVKDRDELIQGMVAYLESVQENKIPEASCSFFIGAQEDDQLEIKSLVSGKLGESLLQVLLTERDLEQIALFWSKGGKVPWEKLHEDEKASIVALPTYPFEKRHYWLSQAAKKAIEKTGLDSSEVDKGGCSESGDLGRHIRTRIGELLGMAPEELPDKKLLNNLGFNSMQAVTLRFKLEQDFDTEIPIAVVSENKTIKDLEQNLRGIIDLKREGRLKADEYDANEQIGAGDAVPPVSGILPMIVPDIANRYEPFSLSDIQASFLAGRKLRFGGDWVGCHIYFEVEAGGVDLYRLNKAWERLVEHHEMLRCTILSNGQQKILAKTPPYKFKIADLRRKDAAERNEHLINLRKVLSHKVYEPEQWPLFEISVSVCPDNKYLIHFSIDEFIVDASGVYLLLQQWQQLYEDPEWKLPELRLSFRDYLVAVKKFEDSPRYKGDMKYWTDRLRNMPGGPRLPVPSRRSVPEAREYYFRTRLNGTLDERQWSALKKKAHQLNVSPTALLLTLFTEFLRHLSEEKTFSIILTFFNRLPLHEQLDHIVGPFISTSLFVVEEPEACSFEEVLRRNQDQLWNDLDHSSVSGIRVLRELKAQGKIKSSLYLPVVFTSMVNGFENDKIPKSKTFFESISFMVTQTPQVYLDHQILEQNGELRFSWDVAKDHFGSDVISAMFNQYCRYLCQVASENDGWEAKPLPFVEREGMSALMGVEGETAPKYAVATKRADEALPEGLTLVVSPADKFKPFPLTDQQQAYVFGRSKYVTGGNFSCQVYEEVEIEGLDVQRLERAWQKLIKAHEMLVTVIGSDGTQRIMKEVPDYRVKVTDLTGKKMEEIQSELLDIKTTMIGHVFSLDSWPYFDLRVSLISGTTSRIHFSIDMLIADANSIHLLLKQLYRLYEDPDQELERSKMLFRDYLSSLQEYKTTEGYQKSIQYWENKFAGIPPGPQLPMNTHGNVTAHGHEQFKDVLLGWTTLKEKARSLSVSPGMILLTAYAEVFAAWLDRKPFSIVVPCWERLPLHPDIYNVVGDFTSLSWVVAEETSFSFEEKVRLNHQTVREDLSHMAVSGLKALRKAMMRGRKNETLNFPVVFTNLMAGSSVKNPPGFTTLEMISKTPQVYLDNISEEHAGNLHFNWDAASGVFPEGMIGKMFSGYTRVLEALAVEPWEKIDFAALIAAQPREFVNLKAGRGGV